jgi:hypothetical protein
MRIEATSWARVELRQETHAGNWSEAPTHPLVPRCAGCGRLRGRKHVHGCPSHPDRLRIKRELAEAKRR